jgi:putative transposase
VKYAAIADWATEKQFSVTFMCAQLGLVRQGYYRWLAKGPSARERTDAELTEQIRRIHAELRGDPGVRRVWAELVAAGVRVATKRVWRLMQAAGLRGRHPRVGRKTTVAGARPVDAPDLLGQDFTAAAPDTRWCGDITYVRTVDGWVYTATVIDPVFPQGGRVCGGRPSADQSDHRGSRGCAADPHTPGRCHFSQ